MSSSLPLDGWFSLLATTSSLLSGDYAKYTMSYPIMLVMNVDINHNYTAAEGRFRGSPVLVVLGADFGELLEGVNLSCCWKVNGEGQYMYSINIFLQHGRTFLLFGGMSWRS